MADGGWTYGAVVDGADDQVGALETIAGGEAGGPPGLIRANLVSDYRGVRRAPIEIAVEGLRRAVNVPGLLRFAIKGVEPRSRPGEAMAIDNTSHPANRRLALAQAGELTVGAFGVSESLLGRGNNGHFAPFKWSG